MISDITVFAGKYKDCCLPLEIGGPAQMFVCLAKHLCPSQQSTMVWINDRRGPATCNRPTFVNFSCRAEMLMHTHTQIYKYKCIKNYKYKKTK